MGDPKGTPPPPYPFGGTEVVREDQAMAPAGALTLGGVPHALNVVLKLSTAPPSDTDEVYESGRSEFCAITSAPVPAGTFPTAGTMPVMRIAAKPPTVTLELDWADSGI